MRRICLLVFVISLLGCQQLSVAPNTHPTPVDINGLWTDASTAHCRNCYAIIAQDGEQIFFAHYLEWKGQPMVEYGQGLRNGDTITYDVKVTLPITGWATSGKHSLILSDDGNMLTGTFSDSLGNEGPFSLRRVQK